MASAVRPMTTRASLVACAVHRPTARAASCAVTTTSLTHARGSPLAAVRGQGERGLRTRLIEARRGAANVVEARKVLREPGVAAFEELVLFARADAARTLGVFVVEPIGHVHAGDDPAERRERLLVVRLRVVPQVDEHLRRPRVGLPGEGKGDGAADVGLLERIVRERARPPCLRDGRVAVDAELRPAARRDAEEPRLVEEAVAHQRHESIRAERRPGARDLDVDVALRRLEPHCGHGRRRLREFRRVRLEEQLATNLGHARRGQCETDDSDKSDRETHVGNPQTRQPIDGWSYRAILYRDLARVICQAPPA